MAILIFERENSHPQCRSRRWTVLACLLGLLSVLAPVRAQHVVTAGARAQAEAILQQAYTTYEGGDYPQAMLLIDKADKLQPDQADSWNLRGAVYLKQGIYDKAAAAFSRAVALDPKLWAAQFNLGEVAFHQKDYRRAQARFEALLNQTDHFKEANRWELAAYKAFLSCLLLGDDAAAHKKLAKLPQKGATPAYLYAQAALSFSRKDVAAAEKTLAIAQSTFPPAANDLFASSFETVGWEAPPPPPVPILPPTPPNSGSAPSYHTEAGERPMQVDPRLEAAVADPLPLNGGSTYAKIPSVDLPQGRADAKPLAKPAVKSGVTAGQPQPPQTPLALGRDNTGLLLQ